MLKWVECTVDMGQFPVFVHEISRRWQPKGTACWDYVRFTDSVLAAKSFDRQKSVNPLPIILSGKMCLFIDLFICVDTVL